MANRIHPIEVRPSSMSSIMNVNDIVVKKPAYGVMNTVADSARKAANSVADGAHRAAHSVANVGRDTMHINRSDTFVSKALRFARADEYTYVASNYDRLSILVNFMTFAVSIVLFIWIVVVWIEHGELPSASYSFGSDVDPAKAKLNSSINGLNNFYTAQSYAKILLTVLGTYASYKQLKIIFKYNDFKKKMDLVAANLSDESDGRESS